MQEPPTLMAQPTCPGARAFALAKRFRRKSFGQDFGFFRPLVTASSALHFGKSALNGSQRRIAISNNVATTRATMYSGFSHHSLASPLFGSTNQAEFVVKAL